MFASIVEWHPTVYGLNILNVLMCYEYIKNVVEMNITSNVLYYINYSKLRAIIVVFR